MASSSHPRRHARHARFPRNVIDILVTFAASTLRGNCSRGIRAYAHRDDDDVAECGEDLSVVDVERRRSAVEASAVDPHHHRQTASPPTTAAGRRVAGLGSRSLAAAAGAGPPRREHVEIEAVLAERRRRVPDGRAVELAERRVRLLVARGRQRGGVADAAPRPDGQRMAEAQLAERRLRERDREVLVDVAADRRNVRASTAHAAAARRHHQVLVAGHPRQHAEQRQRRDDVTGQPHDVI